MNAPGINLKLQPNVIEGHFNQHRVKALVPMCTNGRVASVSNERLSRKSLGLVLLAHALVFAALISVQSIKPPVEVSVKPMLVSFVSTPAPEPEVVPFVPPPPKPEPVIQKKKPKPIVKERVPEPQPEVAEPPVVSEEPPAMVKSAPEPEKLPEPQQAPVAEPKIEPPRAQINPLDSPAPPYPAQSRRLGEEGRVVLRILVSEKGNAETVQVETSSGFDRLDQAAMETVKKKWRFIPAKRDNQPISAYAIVPIKFSLEN